MDRLDAWRGAPSTVVLEPTIEHGWVLRSLLTPLTTAGNLVNDPYLAGRQEAKCEIVSFDNDFSRCRLCVKKSHLTCRFFTQTAARAASHPQKCAAWSTGPGRPAGWCAMEMPAELRELLTLQDNVVAMWQLPVPLRRGAVRAVRRGEWRRLTKKTFFAAPCAASERQRAWAASLHGGPSALLAGRNALVLHGWDADLTAPYDVVVPQRVQPASGPSWMRIHRVAVPLTGPAARPARTSVHLATAHAAAWARTDREAAFIVISVLQQRLTTAYRLLKTLEQLPRIPRRHIIVGIVAEFTVGVHSLNELDFDKLCRRYGVPPPQRQTKRFDRSGRPRAIDVEFLTPSGRVLRLEIEGVQHLDPANYFADITRHNRLQMADPAVGLRVSSWTLKHEAAPFMQELRGWVLEM
ncbi:MAG: hypothetical protein R2686_08250 [Candidatus Nanopelagicales bacterium]